MSRPTRTLHEAIRLVLETIPAREASISRISQEIRRRNLYQQKEGGFPKPFQIFLRAKNYGKMFEAIDRENIRLKYSSELIAERYQPLADYFKSERKSWRALSFKRIEQILGVQLPKTAYKTRQWWGNEKPETTKHVQSRAWMQHGWKVADVDLDGEAVVFVKRLRSTN